MFRVYFDPNLIISQYSDYTIISLLVVILILLPFVRRWLLATHKLEIPIKPAYVAIAIVGWICIKIISIYDISSHLHKIESGNYKVVEGIPTDYETVKGNSREESFTINDVYFKYNNFGTRKMFFANRENNFSLFNGKSVLRISYLEEGNQNLIFKIEVLEKR